MKITLETEKETFRPVTISIVIESKNEGAALFAIFNHSDNADLLEKAGGERIYKVLKDFDTRSGNIIPGVKYHDWY